MGDLSHHCWHERCINSMLYLKYMACSYIFYSLLGRFVFSNTWSKVSVTSMEATKTSTTCQFTVTSLGGGWWTDSQPPGPTGPVKSKSLPSPKVLEAILKLIPLRSCADWCGFGRPGIPQKYQPSGTGLRISKNEALTVSIPKEKIWKATFFGN